MKPMRDYHSSKILFFDGVCNLCNTSVNRVLKGDRSNSILVAPLQGSTAQKLLRDTEINPEELNSLVYWDNERVYAFSDAALRVARDMKFPWALWSFLLIIPRPIRDLVYKYIAKKRYSWFGKKESCRMPTESERARFLD